MKKNLYTPACHKYIHKKDGSPDIQRIFSVAKSAYAAKYPDTEVNGNELFDFLQATIPALKDAEKTALDMERIELCFAIISQYKCNSICQLCAYSPLYKNQYESQEAVLIGYALSNWNNLQRLLKSGVTRRHFRAMVPVSEKSAVPVIPLNRLTYEYMEKVPKSQEDMLSITDKVITTIKQNNKDRLSASDLKVCKQYLDNLFHSNYPFLPPQKITEILKKCFQLHDQNPVEPHPLAPTSPEPSEKQCATRLEGFLLGNPPAVHIGDSVRTFPQKPPDKNPAASRNAAAQTASKKRPAVNEQVSQANPITPKATKPGGGKEVLASYTQASESHTPIAAEHRPERKPNIWKVSKEELSHALLIDLESCGSFQRKQFFDDLLMTPLLPMEIATDSSREWVLVYAGNKVYCYLENNPTILDEILPFVQKSRFRKIICYESYRLYAYFHQQQSHGVQIFSLRLALDFVGPEGIWDSLPDEALRETIPMKNLDQAPTVANCMRNYHPLYVSLTQRLMGMNQDKRSSYNKGVLLSQLMGRSYCLENYCSCKGCLFTVERVEGYVFTYSADAKMRPPYLSVRYQIAWNGPTQFPITTLLTSITEHKILELHDIILLAFDNASVTFAVSSSEYNYLCDLINNLSWHLSRQGRNLPVCIDESILGGKIKRPPSSS